MAGFNTFEGVSIVTTFVLQHNAASVPQKIYEKFGYITLQFDARGNLSLEHWYQKFLPMINPEYEYLQLIVPHSNVDNVMAYLIEIGKLQMPGAGAVFSVPCLNYSGNSEIFSCIENPEFAAPVTLPDGMKEDLSVSYALMQSNRTDAAIRAAMQAGSHGPIIYYAEGRGTRDRIPWLKITKKPYEEVMMTLLDPVDKDFVNDAIIDAGRINTPGGGVLYDLPGGRGLVNLTASLGKSNSSATRHHIVAAIDELKGSADWRDQSAMAGMAGMGKKKTGSNYSGSGNGSMRLLNVLAPRKHVYSLVDAAIGAGSLGANISYAKTLGPTMPEDDSGFVFHQEFGFIRMILPQDQAAQIEGEMKAFCEEQKIDQVAFYQREVGAMVRYQSKSV